MTRSRAAEVDARSRRRKVEPGKRLTFCDDLRAELTYELTAASRVRFPSPRYQRDPVAFCREILGVEPWSRQIDVLNAVRDHARVAVAAGHKVSKLLALDTPVPTPSGWTTIGALRVGDQVFDETGAPRNVLGLSPIVERGACFAVTFDDGTRVVTDATHAWCTWTYRARKACDRAGYARVGPGEVTTTEQIRGTLHTQHAGRNHAVVVTAPIQCVEAQLPIDPYLLGIWLGDGDSARAYVTTPDAEVEAAFHAAGWTTRRTNDDGACWRFAIDPTTSSEGSRFRALLKELGLLRNKHVPAAYMRASEAQRRALLAGLLDTDGTCSLGKVSFTNTNERLAQAVYELAASLGYKPHFAERRATLYGQDCGPCFIVGFTPHDPVFRLPRQLARQHAGKTKLQWTRQRMIVSVEPVESVPVRCIEVDSPSHLFLVSRAFIPTHNSHTAACIALWYFCSFADARVIMTSTTSRQVDQILWRELRMVRARSGRCLACKARDPDGHTIPRPCEHSSLIEGDEGDLARTGLKTPDFREVVGFTAKEGEAVAGISGRHLLYIVDESSGVPDLIFEAIEGNRAGGARIVMFGNPTKNEGEFYEAFHSKSNLYTTLRISSEESPNVVQGRNVIPGLATRDWIEEKRVEWGEKSALYLVRVKGQHAVHEAGKLFSLHTISEAEARWPETPDTGRLFIGLDPAGESGMGDDTCFAVRRGLKLIALRMHSGLNDDQHMAHLDALLATYRLARETPVVVVDRDGPIGSKLYVKLRARLDDSKPEYELVGVKASQRATRQPQFYDRVRDELAANLHLWIRDGGAIYEDTKLEKELHILSWSQRADGRLKVTPKDVIRKALGRSPDRLDALALSVWEPLSLVAGNDLPGASSVKHEYSAPAAAAASVTGMDPYAGMDPWGGGGGTRR